MTMTLKAAIADAGKVSLGNGKMPGSTFAISATKCKVGSKLAAIKDSTCSRCYALKLEKLRPSVNKGWLSNYEKAVTLIDQAPDKWTAACVFQIMRAYVKSNEAYHRWFDSGDLQSIAMLSAICDVARKTPLIAHWLPTRESGIVKAYLAQGGVLPANLIVRVSSTMIGDAPISGHANTSTVHRKKSDHIGHACPASTQGNSCGTGDNACRACWNHSVPNISYPLH